MAGGFRETGARLLRRLRAARGLPVWTHPDYRLPMTSVAARTGLEPRRADLAAWYLLDGGLLRRRDLRLPRPVPYRDLCRVHDADYLESLTRPATLARIFGVEDWDVPVDEVLRTVRLACGGTVEAAREALRRRGPTLNLLGGMHHAGPARGGGSCPVNDVAVAIAVVRAEGLARTVAVLDLDAHPPDGTAECLAGDPDAWLGSISGADWGPLPGEPDETVLPEGAGDDAYLEALDALLSRMPPADLAIVLAGGDVLERDPVGPLSLSEAGAAERDRRVARALRGRASAWLAAGGYGPDSWRALAGTAMVLALGRAEPIPPDADPMSTHFAVLSRGLPPRGEPAEPWLTEADLADALGLGGAASPRLLGELGAEAIELALSRYGILPQIRRLGYSSFRVTIDRTGTGERARLHGRAGGAEHLLVEMVLAREQVPVPWDEAPREVLFVHWLTLRHPLARFGPRRPRLPGQEVPGLGMAREAGEMLDRLAARLDLEGVAVRPAWFHVAYTCRYRFRFVEAERQGRFEALVRDLDALGLGLRAASLAVAEGRVRAGGEPWRWEPGLMVAWRRRGPPPPWVERVAEVREATRFTVDPAEEE